MFFIIDAILIILLLCVVWFGIKRGFTGNWIFNILKTIVSIAAGAGAAVGIYFLMNAFGWLDVLGDGVISFFGNIGVNYGEPLTVENYRMVCNIIAFIPFGVLGFILGYYLAYKLIGLFFKLITVPLARAREYTVWCVIDNIVGIIFNLAVFGSLVLVVFGAIHAINAGDKYKNIAGDQGVGKTFSRSLEAALDGMNEDLSAGPLSGLIYEYNPLNGLFEQIIGK